MGAERLTSGETGLGFGFKGVNDAFVGGGVPEKITALVIHSLIICQFLRDGL